MMAALVPALLFLLGEAADACPRYRSTLPAPTVEDAGFEPLRAGDRTLSGGHLWVKLAPNDPLAPSTYVLELIGGRAPRSLGDWWGRSIAADGDQLIVPVRSPAASLELTPDQPLVFGFQVRAVDGEGRAGDASEPVWLSFDPSHPVRAIDSSAPRSDHVLFFLLAIGLGVLWYWYRREPSGENKIRLAALTALGSLILLSVTAAMPWLMAEAGGIGRAPIECLLGQEAACAYQAGSATLTAAGSDPQLLARVGFEVQRWQCASAALRMGQVTVLALLLPALVWLLVDPRHRAAQAAAAVGASVAGFTLMVVVLYRHSIPTWLGADPYWTADIAIMATTNIVIAAVLIVRQSFAFLNHLPTPVAVARYRRDRG
ncbi:MAG TPA: hypothetical protein VK698_30515 [Kofleriaceae bacterium]|nr:hypothetical protein [Kofleriaceae bacterium]